MGKSFVGHRRFIYLPIEGVNVAPRVNPNYLPELLSTTSESYRQPNYSPVPHTRAYVLSALNTSTQPTAAIPYPVSYSQSDIRMHATKQHYFDSNGIDNESTRYNAFQEKVESPQSLAQPMASSPHFTNTYCKPLQLVSLNLKFTGESDIDEFLLRVNEGRLARQIDDATLVRGFSELLSGTALKFYRTVSHRLSSWLNICSEFRRYFQSKDYSYNIEKQIRERKQLPGQSVSFFVLDIQDMNSRLAFPIGQENLLEIVKHNMLSAYAQLLSINDIASFDQLINISKNF